MRRLLAILLFIACCAPVRAQEDAALDARLRAIAAAYDGRVALYATDMRSGKTVALNADTPVPTASVIKLTVLYEALKQVEEGKVRLDERLTLTKDDQVEGSGILMLFDTPQTLTFKDALSLMIDLSDNTATNLLIDRLGLANIDARIQSLGLHDTWLYKKVFRPAVPPVPADQPQFGLGKTTAREMAQVIGRFETCDLKAALCALAIDILKHQTDGNAIPRYLHDPVANKTGALEEVRNDVGIVYAKNGPVVISAFTYENKDRSWTPDNRAQLLIAKLAQTIVERWQ